MIKIKYRNSCDLGGTVFTIPENPFYYILYLDNDLACGTYEIVDEGREDGEKNFVSDFKKLWKKHSITTVVSEFIYDALCFIQLHDTIFVTLANDESSRVYNFSVKLNEWNTAGTTNAAGITIEFTSDYTAKYGCCNDGIVYKPCRTCSSRVIPVDIITPSDAVFNDPIGEDAVTGTYYMILDQGHYQINQFTIEYNSRLRTAPTPVWTVYEPKLSDEVVCLTHGGINYKFYYDGSFWQPYLLMGALTDSGTQINVKGYGLPNTWVQLEVSINGGAYANYSGPLDSATFQIYGKSVTGLTTGFTYAFKFTNYDNNCNYGTSNILSTIKL